MAHLEAQQGLSLAVATDGRFSSAPATPASSFALGAAEKHEYASDVLDAGALARFGRVEVEPGSAGYELLTRSGNVEQPVRGWSDWQPLKDGAVASPAGRFLQWKAVLHADGMLGSVGVNYLPVNSAPVVDDLVVVPGARLESARVSPPASRRRSTSRFPRPARMPAIVDSMAARQRHCRPSRTAPRSPCAGRRTMTTATI